jgi:hypothetical protein
MFILELFENNRKSSGPERGSTALDKWLSKFRNETFILPSDIANKPVGIRLNIVTQGAGEHSLTIENVSIT